MSRTKTPKKIIPTTTQTSVDDAITRRRREVENLNAAELRLAIAYRTKADELAVVKAARGDAVLDAADTDGTVRAIGQQVSALLQELDALADAGRRARERRLAAIPAVFHAESDHKEARATAMEAEATTLEVESNRLRATLEQHDDWGYVAAEGRVDGQFVGSVAHGNGQYRVVDARGPKFMRLRGEAQALRTQAAQGRFKVAHEAGSVEAESLEDLIAMVHSDPMRLGPPAEKIIEWVEQSVEKERKRRARAHSTEDAFVGPDFPLRMHLEWRAGVIDVAGSHIVMPETVGDREPHPWAEGSEPIRTTAPAAVGRTIDEILGEPPGAASPYDDTDLVVAEARQQAERSVTTVVPPHAAARSTDPLAGLLARMEGRRKART